MILAIKKESKVTISGLEVLVPRATITEKEDGFVVEISETDIGMLARFHLEKMLGCQNVYWCS